MAHRLRMALKDGGFELASGEFEVDETFIGGLARFMHKADRARKRSPARAGPEKRL